ncbi:multidrug efflux SMR transporter [Apibacter raozihei]|uniref:DMT family transporter n=1 Tax=Apibacter raozihei TaxID=2500547 RepID=UPI000FE3C78A|nr:multidrug efflux SMR transporter [Apibacter raozihei]
MNWILLVLGGLFEVGFTYSLGQARISQGSSVYWWYGCFFICLILSMSLLIKATEQLPLGTAYAVWTGIGAVGTVALGILVFKEPVTFWRIFFISTLIASIIGLKFVSSH